jgi:hypothetical protein
VSCPSASFCAVFGGGAVYTSSIPTAGAKAWDATQLDSPLVAVQGDCLLSGLCVAINSSSEVLSTTDPTGGASAWTVAAIAGGAGLTPVSCPSVALCVAASQSGDLLTSTDPTAGAHAWSNTVPRTPLVSCGPHGEQCQAQLAGVSCPTASFCAAIDGAGDVLTSENPTGGAASWTATDIDTPNTSAGEQLSGISCPSQQLCVAIDPAGRIVTSTDPAATPSQWARSTIDPHNFLDGVSCPTTTFCATVDQQGDVLTSQDPGAGAHAWTRTSLGPGELAAVDCPSARFCVAADYGGDVVIGTPPPTRARTIAMLHGHLAPPDRPATIASILRNGDYSSPFQAISAGRLTITWYQPAERRRHTNGPDRSRIAAAGVTRLNHPGSTRITVKLTRQGKALLRQTNRVSLIARGVFVAPQARAVTVTQKFTL